MTWYAFMGGRKYFLALAGLVIITVLLWWGKLSQDNFVLLFGGIVIAQGAFNLGEYQIRKGEPPKVE